MKYVLIIVGILLTNTAELFEKEKKDYTSSSFYLKRLTPIGIITFICGLLLSIFGLYQTYQDDKINSLKNINDSLFLAKKNHTDSIHFSEIIKSQKTRYSLDSIEFQKIISLQDQVIKSNGLQFHKSEQIHLLADSIKNLKTGGNSHLNFLWTGGGSSIELFFRCTGNYPLEQINLQIYEVKNFINIPSTILQLQSSGMDTTKPILDKSYNAITPDRTVYIGWIRFNSDYSGLNVFVSSGAKRWIHLLRFFSFENPNLDPNLNIRNLNYWAYRAMAIHKCRLVDIELNGYLPPPNKLENVNWFSDKFFLESCY